MKPIWLVLLMWLLSACSFSSGNLPADHFYRLPAPAAVTTAMPVSIDSVRAEGIYNERALLFVETARPLELHRYDYHFWAQTPAKLTQSYLTACLANPAADKATSVKKLTPVIESFERVLDSGKAQALIKLRINQRVYEAKVTADSMDMHATVAAYGQAMQIICEAIARDI